MYAVNNQTGYTRPEFVMFVTCSGVRMVPLNHPAMYLLCLFDPSDEGVMDFDQATAMLYDEKIILN